MKKIWNALCALAAFGALSAPAVAADMRMPVKAPPPVAAPIFTWTGFYIGINGGYGWAESEWDFLPAGLNEGGHDLDGGTVGGQIGYNWQVGSWVFGLEAQGNWADLSGERVSLLFPATTNSTSVDALGLFTGRIGWAWDRFMIYAKGGAAVMNVEHSFFNTATGIVGGSADATRWGATVGGGFEWAFAPNWSAGFEYNHLFMGDNDVDFEPLPNVSNRVSLDADLFLVRVNYRFGGPATAPYPY